MEVEHWNLDDLHIILTTKMEILQWCYANHVVNEGNVSSSVVVDGAQKIVLFRLDSCYHAEFECTAYQAEQLWAID